MQLHVATLAPTKPAEKVGWEIPQSWANSDMQDNLQHTESSEIVRGQLCYPFCIGYILSWPLLACSPVYHRGDEELGQEWIQSCSKSRICTAVTGLGEWDDEGCLLLLSVHKTSVLSLNSFRRKSPRFRPEGIQSTASLYSWWQAVSFFDTLPHSFII